MDLVKSLILVLLSVSAHAGEIPKQLAFSCVTEFPTTSFVSAEQNVDNKLKMVVLNHNGVKYMPIHNGLVTVNDIAVMAERAKLLEQVGEEIEASFDLKDCSVYQDKTFSCYHGGKFQRGKTEFEVFSVWSAKDDLMFIDLKFPQWTMTLSVIVNEVMYHIPMTFYDRDCMFDFGDLGKVNPNPLKKLLFKK